MEEYVALIHTELSDYIGKRDKAVLEPQVLNQRIIEDFEGKITMIF